jgi:rRNA maturation endonuclease Nob1
VSGDLPRLSPVDLDLIALCLECEQSVLYTDDYRIQNTLSQADREWKVVQQRGITAEWIWVQRCSGCGLESSPAVNEKAGSCNPCDHCGSPQLLKRRLK